LGPFSRDGRPMAAVCSHNGTVLFAARHTRETGVCSAITVGRHWLIWDWKHHRFSTRYWMGGLFLTTERRARKWRNKRVGKWETLLPELVRENRSAQCQKRARAKW
jgi:hypothetical protein